MSTAHSQRPRLLESIMGIPRWVQVWVTILAGTNLASLAFLDTGVGLWTAAALAVVASINLPMMFVQRGLTRLLSVPHLVWLPLLPYLYLSLFGESPLPPGSVRVFASAVLAVNFVSLLFDFFETGRWFKGHREVLGVGATNLGAAANPFPPPRPPK